MDPAVQTFRELLLRLRNGTVTYEDWQTVLLRDPSKVPNSSDFEDAVHLFYDKKSVAEHNMTRLKTLHQPIARINAIHSCASAAAAKSDDAGGLYPTFSCSRCQGHADRQSLAGGRSLQWCSWNSMNGYRIANLEGQLLSR